MEQVGPPRGQVKEEEARGWRWEEEGEWDPWEAHTRFCFRKELVVSRAAGRRESKEDERGKGPWFRPHGGSLGLSVRALLED